MELTLRYWSSRGFTNRRIDTHEGSELKVPRPVAEPGLLADLTDTEASALSPVDTRQPLITRPVPRHQQTHKSPLANSPQAGSTQGTLEIFPSKTAHVVANGVTFNSEHQLPKKFTDTDQFQSLRCQNSEPLWSFSTLELIRSCNLRVLEPCQFYKHCSFYCGQTG